MKIENDKIVSFHYELFEQEALLEISDKETPATYLHGHNGMLKGVEEQLEGKQAGEKFEFTLEPEKAYGVHQTVKPQRVPLKHVLGVNKANPRLKPGDVIAVNTADGARDVTVIKAGKFNVDVDTNHPFAGKTLTFKVEVIDVRDASEEEIAHGHVHGPDGHAH